MTGEELIELASEIAEDDIPEAFAIQGLNVAKNKREDARPWAFLKTLDSSKTASPGDTWQTSKALPDNFRRDYRMLVGTSFEYFPIPFEQRIAYKDAFGRYVIDLANEVYYLTGRIGVAATIYLHYLKTTTEFSAANLETPEILVWPERFQPLLAFDLAGMFQGGVDFDAVSARMSPFNRQMAKDLEDAMTSWDTQLQLRAMNDSYGGFGDAGMPLGMM